MYYKNSQSIICFNKIPKRINTMKDTKNPDLEHKKMTIGNKLGLVTITRIYYTNFIKLPSPKRIELQDMRVINKHKPNKIFTYIFSKGNHCCRSTTENEDYIKTSFIYQHSSILSINPSSNLPHKDNHLNCLSHTQLSFPLIKQGN